MRVSLLCFLALTAVVALPQAADAALAITTPANIGVFSVGPVQFPLQASGGSGTLTWSITAGSLPPGVALRTDVPSFFQAGTAAGLLGVATTAGTYSFTIQVVDSTASPVSLPVTMKVVTTALKDSFTLPDAFANTSYSYSFGILNGTAPTVAWSGSGNALPPGLSIIGGVLTGTPTTPSANGSNYNFQLQITDGSDSIFRNVNLKVAGPHITNAGVLPNGTVNTAYNVPLTATGGAGGYSYQVTSGSLPQGLSISGGAITGTISNSNIGRNTFSITVTDSASATYQQPFSLAVLAAATTLPAIQTTFFNDATLGNPYTATVSASGGVPPYVWNATGLPAGLFFRSGFGTTTPFVSPGDLEIWGVPQATATTQVSLTATDANSVSVTVTLPLRVSPLFLTNQNFSATLNTALNPPLQLQILGGTGPYSASDNFSALPTGLTVNSSATGGNITGTPLENGSFNTRFQYYDSTGLSTSLFVPTNVTVTNPAGPRSNQ